MILEFSQGKEGGGPLSPTIQKFSQRKGEGFKPYDPKDFLKEATASCPAIPKFSQRKGGGFEPYDPEFFREKGEGGGLRALRSWSFLRERGKASSLTIPKFSQRKGKGFEPYDLRVFLEKGKAFAPCDPEVFSEKWEGLRALQSGSFFWERWRASSHTIPIFSQRKEKSFEHYDPKVFSKGGRAPSPTITKFS